MVKVTDVPDTEPVIDVMSLVLAPIHPDPVEVSAVSRQSPGTHEASESAAPDCASVMW
jgi:hypothetical protein